MGFPAQDGYPVQHWEELTPEVLPGWGQVGARLGDPKKKRFGTYPLVN